MKYLYLRLLIFILFAVPFSVIAQKKVVSVNQLTGGINGNIPLYTLSRGAITLPINLVYYSSGIKPKDVEGSAGIGWNLQAGGEIDRQMRGLPDDSKKDKSGLSRLGWLYNSNSSKISSFSISNDNSSSTCPDETADINYINANFNDQSDTEPDIFSVNAPGLSCELVFDNNHVLRSRNYQDLVITYKTDSITTDPLYGAIISFTIKNSQGITYVFGASDLVTQQASTNTDSFTGGTATYFSNQYHQFQNGIQYYSNWHLNSITDANGNGFVFNYSAGNARTSENDIILYAGASGGTTVANPQYAITSTVTPQILSSILTNDNGSLNTAFTLAFSTSINTNQSILYSLTGFGRIYSFRYATVNSTDSKTIYGRNFLQAVFDQGCGSPINYSFEYSGVNYVNSSVTLCDSATAHTDYWGYYSSNASTSGVPSLYVNPNNSSRQRYAPYSSSVGADYSVLLNATVRTVDTLNVMAGCLNKVSYGEGGYTTISYQSNDYLDVPSNTVQKGCGVRVKQITDYDGINTANNIVTTYSYVDTTGRSSGKPVTLPVFGFTVPYTGTATGADYWNYSTMRSADDLSNEDHTILYAYTRVTRAGAGSTVYKFYIPATNWDNSAAPACSGCASPDWSPTINYIARNTCASYGPVKNDIDTYPFVYNPNYDFERGLLLKTINYNDAMGEISETNYSYTRSNAPVAFQALKWEDNSGVKAYSKYTVYFGASELIRQVTQKVFDSKNLNQPQTSSTSFTYGSPYHKRVTQQQVTNSDNSILTTNISYSRDYNVSAGSNPNVSALFYLQQHNINVPVESYTQVKRGTNPVLTTSAELTLFTSVTPGSQTLFLPSQKLNFFSADGISDFQTYSILGQTAVSDTRYVPSANYQSYDYTGNLLTIDDAHHKVQTIVTDHKSFRLVASFANAASTEVAFDDFDSTLPSQVTYTVSGTASGSTPIGSHTGNASSISGSQVFSKALNKNPLAKYYIVSAWINTTGTGTLNITLVNSNNQSTPNPQTLDNTGGTWKYCEWKIPVTGMTPTFTMQISSSILVGIDDLLIYPDNATASTVAYDHVSFYKIAETNTNGVSAYYQNDQYGRLIYSFDQDKNITEKRTYATPSLLATGMIPIISVTPLSPTISNPVNFTASTSSNCITGTTYNWDFGDGTVISNGGSTQTHTYTAVNTYTVKVTAINPVFGSKSNYTNVTVLPPPLVANICLSGVTAWDNCNFVALHTIGCGSNPNDANNSYYTVSLTGVLGTVTYQWQISYNNNTSTPTWTNIGTNSYQFVMPRSGKIQSSWVRCVVTTSSGQGVTSGFAYFDAPTGPCR